MNKTKSPIKNLPVHMPGQSISARIDSVLDNHVTEPFMMSSILVALAFMEWWRTYFHIRPMPKLYTLMALIGIWWAYRKIRKAKREIDNLNLGLIGERAVGQYLEEALMPLKHQVFHDIPGETFNIDHLVVGPNGVFCIETKTRSKPAAGPCHIQYDGESVKVNGMAPDRDPIIQAKAAARWTHELLESSTGKKFTVQPIVLFPGWFVESNHEQHDVWVLNEKGAPVFIQRTKKQLTSEDVSLISFHLKRYIISVDSLKAGKTPNAA
ncbi:MAG: nuclease-related domain-containing protein, partial [Victivallaceae bacterium]